MNCNLNAVGHAKRGVRVLKAKETMKHKGPKVVTSLMWSRSRKRTDVTRWKRKE